MSTEQFGRDLGDFLAGLRGSGSVTRSQPAAFSQVAMADAKASATATALDLTAITLLPNSAARLPSGHLVLGVQSNNSAYRLDPASGELEVLFDLTNTLAFLWRTIPTKDGQLYVSLSGTRPPGGGNLQWGGQGIVFSIDLIRERISPIPGYERLIDPVDLTVLQDGKLLVVDFMGFNGAGAIYIIDPSTGDTKQIDLTGHLHDPNCAYLDPDGVLFVANPWQSYQNPRGPDGLPLKDHGNIIMIDPATQKVETIYDNSNDPKGSIVGVTGTSDKKYIVAVCTDWPLLNTSALLRIDRSSRQATPLIAASDSVRRFFSPRCATVGNLIYAADSYQRELLAIDIDSGKVTKSFDMRPILGGGTGIVSSTQSIESVAVIP
jgi:DNA-binding beta-propeller fold protein YncE